MFFVSPKSTPSSPSLCIGFPSSDSSMSSTSSTSSRSSSSSSSVSSSSSTSGICAYPCWPMGTTLRTPSGGFSDGSSYISDEDLFGSDDLDSSAYSAVPYLDCAPSPPRMYAAPVTVAPLAPLYAAAKAEKKNKRRTSRKLSSRSGRMTPILESPTTPE